MKLEHGRVTLHLEPLTEGSGGESLLLLHELGGSAADFAGRVGAWRGAAFALDFCGHGRSQPVRGGAYSPELLAGDADAALAAIGPARVVGAGLGAYVALLLAAGRPDAVHAALLLPGEGLEGGGARPDFASPPPADEGPLGALGRLGHDVRPVDYALRLAPAARRLFLAEDGGPRPPWWEAVRRAPSARSGSFDLDSGIARLAQD